MSIIMRCKTTILLLLNSNVIDNIILCLLELNQFDGIAKRTVQEAKKIAEIKAYKKGKSWYWHMEVGDSI